MTREEFKKEMSAIFPRYNELRDILRIVGTEQYAALNKYFCYGETYPWGVECLYCNCHSVFDFSIRYTTRCGRRQTLYETEYQYYIDKGYNTHGLNETQMSAIVDFVKSKTTEMENNLAALYERGKNEMSIEDLEKECEKVANEILAGKTNKYGNQLRATLSLGKRGCDTNSEPYRALIVEYYGHDFGKYDWYYYAGFRFRKDKFGINHMKFFRPLCGECEMTFDVDLFKKYIISFTQKK